MKKFALFLTLSLLLSILNLKPVDAISCKKYHVVFARGSGQELNGPDYQSFKSAFLKYFPDAEYYELGTEKQAGFQYPAVSIANFNTLLGAKISAGKTFTYGKSVKQGIGELENYIKNVSLTCPGTKFILGGYSQGAQVISTTLPKIDASKIAYAATFGDPKLYLPEGKAKVSGVPPACLSSKNLSNYRVNVPDCEVYEGILNASRPYQHSGYQDKLGAWCNIGDIICGSYLVSSTNIMKGHSYYRTDGSHAHAARMAYKATQGHVTTNYHDLAVLIDTTASMENLIYGYKAEASRLAENIIKKGGRIALFTYGDLESTKPAMLCDFDCSLSEFNEKLNNITVDNNDSDVNESTLSASLYALNTLKWRKGATKSVVILTDAGYHNPDRDGATLDQVIKRAWEIDPVNFYTISTQLSAYSELTSKTNGYQFAYDLELADSTDFLLDKSEENLTPPYRYQTAREIPYLSLKSKSFTEGTLEISLDTSNNFNLMSVAVNDTLLGFTTDITLQITDLDQNSTVALTPFSTTGHKGDPIVINLNPSVKNQLKTPNTGRAKTLLFSHK